MTLIHFARRRLPDNLNWYHDSQMTPREAPLTPRSAKLSLPPGLSGVTVTTGSESGTSTPGKWSTTSRKGKEREFERAADEASINSVDIEGELVTTQGDGLAAKGLRELVRRSTGLEKTGEGSRSRAASVNGQLSAARISSVNS